jgi:hypothetical protein
VNIKNAYTLFMLLPTRIYNSKLTNLRQWRYLKSRHIRLRFWRPDSPAPGLQVVVRSKPASTWALKEILQKKNSYSLERFGRWERISCPRGGYTQATIQEGEESQMVSIGIPRFS